MEFFYFYISVLICTITILGYSFIFYKIFGLKEQTISVDIIYGIFFMGALALIINFFYPLNKAINNLFLILGVVAFLVNLKKFDNYFYLFLISFICFISLVLENTNRPDAGLYHLPYISNLNENKIIFGLNNLHSRFGHISFYQYISAIFSNNLFNERAIFFPIGILYASVLIYFYTEAKSKINEIDVKILSLFFLIYVIIDMNRFSEFGNDEVGHMLFFIFILNTFILIKEIKYKNEFNSRINFILILSLFLFLSKTTYSLIIILLIYVFFISKIKIHFLLNKFNYFLLFIFFCWLTKNLLISGCFIYPVNITCFENILWSNNFSQKESIIIEAWAKGYPDSDKKLNYKEYIANFNWIYTWFNHHLIFILKKLSLFLIILLPLSYYIRHHGKYIQKKNSTKVLLFFSFLFSLIWLIKFPLYRFGAGYLVTTIVLITILFLKKINITNFNFSFKILTIFMTIIILSKNSKRIHDRLNLQYFDYPYINIYSENNNIKKRYKKIFYKNKDEYFYTPVKGSCYYSPAPCAKPKENYELNISYWNGFKIIFRN